MSLPCVLKQDTLILALSTGSSKEDLCRHNRKIIDWDIKIHNQTKTTVIELVANMKTGSSKVIKKLCSTRLSMKFQLLVKTKMLKDRHFLVSNSQTLFLSC